jgi:hypothetical protein
MAIGVSYNTLWLQYLDYQYYPDSEEVKKLIGGGVNVSWVKNTCCVRLSYGFNYVNIPIPSNFGDMTTYKGKDGKRYAIRVRDMRKWMTSKFGNPEFDVKKTAGAAFDKTPIQATKGVIGFDISFGDATGHVDLWDGVEFTSEYNTSTNYWTAANRISIWKTS